MSVNYGRYVISFDKEDQMWNADPKARRLKIRDEVMEYSFPPSITFVEKTRGALQDAMRKDGAGRIYTRKGEWVVNYNPMDLPK